MGEGEWSRIIAEMGPLLGLAYIILRLAIVFTMLKVAYKSIVRKNDILPISLFAAASPLIIIGQWGPPTILGFAVFGAGLTLAAANCLEEPVLRKIQRKRMRPDIQSRIAQRAQLIKSIKVKT